MFARMINILIATWVLVAAFAWPMPTALFVAMVLVGLGVIAGSVLHMYRGRFRAVTLVFAALLVVSGFLFQARTDFILWNNFLCGVAIGVLSLLSTKETRRGRWIPSTTRREAHVR